MIARRLKDSGNTKKEKFKIRLCLIRAFHSGTEEAAEVIALSEAMIEIYLRDAANKMEDLSESAGAEKEASAFDEYDKENGYEEDEREPLDVMIENAYQVVKTSIQALHESYTQIMDEDLYQLVDFLKFETESG